MTKENGCLDLDVTDMLQENYVPSESERKKVVLYYFLVGILISINRKDISKYEVFHLKQAIWWWTIFFLVFISSMFFIFLPFIKIIPILIFLFMFVIWIVFVKQSWEGKYSIDITWKEERLLFPFFVWLWNWMLEVFDIKFQVKK